MLENLETQAWMCVNPVLIHYTLVYKNRELRLCQSFSMEEIELGEFF